MKKKSNLFLIISILMVIGSLNFHIWSTMKNRYDNIVKTAIENTEGYGIDISDDINIDYFLDNLIITSEYSQKKVNNSCLFLGNDSTNCRNMFSLVEQKTLVFRFSGKFCAACNKFAIDKMKQYFPDSFSSKKIVLIGSDIDPRLRDSFYGKQIYNLLSTDLGFSFEKGGIPFFFIIDENGKVEMTFIPDHSVSVYTDKYLELIKRNYFTN